MDIASKAAPPAGTDELTSHGRSLAERAGGAVDFRLEGPWAHVVPEGAFPVGQGWKLHLSATETSAAAVLSAVVPVLVGAGVAFKFAATRGTVEALNSAGIDRAHAGKFLTVYPPDEEAAVRLAEECHQATVGLDGPVIVSDRAYRPGSLVHYRYGGFSDRHAVDDDGVVVHLIRHPGGALVPDDRRPGVVAPPWAEDPFRPSGPRPGVGPAKPPEGAVLLNDRYLVRAALRHANKGGTYLAEDRLSGAGVVVKEGRPHVGGALDARDAVRHEAAMLARLAPTGRVPAVVDVFEQGGHVFLVTERVDGMSLRDLVDGSFDPPDVGVPGPDVAALSVRLAAAMAAVHAAGVVLRDFTPNNLMVGADGAVTIVDLELAHPADEGPATPAGTPGYASPEQLAGQPSGFADDYWSLGAVIAYVATGADPYFPSHSAHTWSDTDRLYVWMARLLAGGQIGARLADLVLGCMAAVPTERIGPAGVVPALTAERAPRRPRRAVEDEAPEPGSLTEWLLATMGEGTGGHLWPAGPSGMALDPANVQSGASGTGLYLCQAVRTGASDMRVRAAIAETAGWVSDRIAGGPRRPPGLHFGLTGMIWFLAEAADIAGRPDLRRHAGELALGLPVRSLNPDLSHGTAGIGLGQLHQWLRTGDERFLARAALAADHLVRIFQTSTVDGATALVWPVPDETPSRLAGTVSYGYAHGTAGIATFLLYAAAATGEDRFSSLGLAALRSLIPVAVLTPDGAAYWPVGPGNDELWPHWCNGSSGIGTAMLRAYAVSGDGSFLRFARAAALAGCREAWRSSPVQCHGLAGDAQLLLDLADVNPGDPEPWTGLASEAARNLWLRRRHERGWTAFADEGGAVTSAGLGTGTAGVGAFLLRWSHGGDRLLMLDELLG